MAHPASRRLGFQAALILGCAVYGWTVCGCASLRPEPDADLRPSLSSEELFQVALYQAKRGDFFRAEQYLLAARSQGYDTDATAYWLVRVCVLAGRYHSALGHAQEHLRHQPGNWHLRLVVASIHEALGELTKAQQELEGVIRAQPERALAHYRIGILYGQRPSTEDAARKHLQKYLELQPGGTHAAEVRAALEALSVSPHTAAVPPEERQ